MSGCRHNSLRSALRCGIRERRCRNQVADVGTLITGDEAFRDTGPHGAVRSAGLVRKAVECRLDKAFLEVFARVPGHDLIAQLRRKLIEPCPEHIESHTRME